MGTYKKKPSPLDYEFKKRPDILAYEFDIEEIELEEKEWLKKILSITGYALVGLKHVSNHTMKAIKYAAPQLSTVLGNLSSLSYVFEGLIGTTEALNYFYKANELNRFNNIATAWASYQLASSTVLNTASIMSLLSATGSLSGVVAAASGPLAPIVYSVILCGQAIHSTAEFIHELRKYKDPIYQETNLNKKLKNLDIKLVKLKEKLLELDQTDPENYFIKNQKIKHKIEKLEKEQKAVFQHALLHARFGLKNNEPNEYLKNYSKKYTYLESVLNDPSINNKNIHEALRKNQRDKIMEKHINSISSTLAATGMILVTASLFAGPAAPALMAAGITIAAIGGAIKLAYVLEKKLGNYIAEKRFCKANKMTPQEARKHALAEVFGVGKESPELDAIMKTMREKDLEKIASRYYREKSLNYKKAAQQLASSSVRFFKNITTKKKVEEIELPTLSSRPIAVK